MSISVHIEVNTVAKRLEDIQLQALIEQHTVVVDASDNVDTRNQLNRLCFATKRRVKRVRRTSTVTVSDSSAAARSRPSTLAR